MSAEIDSIFNDGLALIHENMNETAGFIHRKQNAGDDDTNDAAFDGIFTIKDTDIDPEENDFMSSYEFDAMLSVLDTVTITFNKGDLVYRNHDKSTWEVLVSLKINGENIVLLYKAVKQLVGWK